MIFYKKQCQIRFENDPTKHPFKILKKRGKLGRTIFQRQFFYVLIVDLNYNRNMLEQVSSPDHSDEELNYRQFMQLHKQTKSKRTKHTKSSKELQPLKQQAMKSYIIGELSEVKQKVMQMITVDPKNSDSYFMMGEAYQHDDDKMRAAHYYSLSIQLSSAPNPRLWEKIGDLYFQIEFFQQSAYCYGRCLKSEPFNTQVLLKRSKAYENGEEYRKALLVNQKLLKIGLNVNIIKDSAKLHCKLGQFDKARDILKQIPVQDVNVIYMICETWMKEKKYAELVEEINKNLLENGQCSPSTLMPQFLKMMVVAGFALNLPDTHKYLDDLVSQLDEDMAELLESLIEQLNNQNRQDESSKILQAFIDDKTFPKKPEYYLKLADYYIQNEELTKSNEILEKGRRQFPGNKNIKSELGFLKIKIGELEKGVEMVQEVKQESDEEIYISDLSQDEKPVKVSKVMKKPNVSSEETKVDKKKQRKEKLKEKKEKLKSKDADYDPQADQQDPEIQQNQLKNSIDKRISHLHETVVLKQDEPHVLLQFYTNISSLLKDVVAYYNKLKQQTYVEPYVEQKRGLFSKKVRHRKRRAKAQNKQTISQQHLVKMLYIWITNVYRTSCWYKIFSLSTTISKLILLKKYPEERKRIYQLCVLACLQFKRYRRAYFLLKYLLADDANNIFYVLLCNVLIRRINAPKTGRFVISKLAHHQNKYPNLSYIIAFEHLESGYFEHSLKSLLKIPADNYNQQNIMLCFVSCFIQLASSRNTTDKLSMVNRATYMLNEYRKVTQTKNQKSFELLYNLARFYHQLKITSKAIKYYKQAIEIGRQVKSQSLNRAVYCLMFLYRELEDYQGYVALSKQYFSI